MSFSRAFHHKLLKWYFCTFTEYMSTKNSDIHKNLCSALVCLHVSIVCHLFVIQCTIKNIVFRNNHYWENVCHLWLILFSFQRLGVHFELVAFVLLNYLYRRDEFATLAHCLINSTIVILSSSQLWFIQRHFIFVFMSKCWYFTCLKLNGIVLLSVIWI